MSRYYCTCQKGEKTSIEGHTKMKPTKVNDDKTCIYCGYYAMESSESPSYNGRITQTKMAADAKKRECNHILNNKDKGKEINYAGRFDPSYIIYHSQMEQ